MSTGEIPTESLEQFKRETVDLLKQLQESGAPMILTVDGKAELVVQNVEAYRRLVERAAQHEHQLAVHAIREGLDDVAAGRMRPASEALADIAGKYRISQTD